MKLVEWALRYAERGFPVFPLAERSKIPLKNTQGLKDATTDPAVVRAAWAKNPNLNIGLAVPGDYVVVDVDDEQALQVLSAQDVTLPATVRAKTARGYHFWYRCAPSEFRPKVGIFEGVDIRAMGGYVVAPPSIHPSGVRYSWLVPPKAGSFAPRPDWLAQLGAKASEEKAEPVRAESVLAGIDQGARDVTLFRYACSLRHRGIGREEAEALVLHAAANSSPPFPKAKAIEKVASAWKYKSERDERRKEEAKHWTADEFMRADFPPPRWFVQGILPEGLTLVVSPGKVGKSVLVGNVAYAVAVGGAVLGFLRAHRADVLYLDLEQSEGPAQERWRKIVGPSPPSNLHLCFEWPRLGDGCVRRLEAYLSEEPTVGVVVVDVLSLIWPMETRRGVNAYHQEYEILTRLKAVAKRWGIALVLVHHTNRGTHSDQLNTTSGTAAMTGVPDAVWMLSRERGKSTGELFVTGRSVAELKEPLIWDATSLTWRFEHCPSGLSRHDSEVTN
jgi:hypothetical protein